MDPSLSTTDPGSLTVQDMASPCSVCPSRSRRERWERRRDDHSGEPGTPEGKSIGVRRSRIPRSWKASHSLPSAPSLLGREGLPTPTSPPTPVLGSPQLAPPLSTWSRAASSSPSRSPSRCRSRNWTLLWLTIVWGLPCWRGAPTAGEGLVSVMEDWSLDPANSLSRCEPTISRGADLKNVTTSGCERCSRQIRGNRAQDVLASGYYERFVKEIVAPQQSEARWSLHPPHREGH